MHSFVATLAGLAVVMVLSGCTETSTEGGYSNSNVNTLSARMDVGQVSEAAAISPSMDKLASPPQEGDSENSPARKYIAERQQWVFETTSKELIPLWRQHLSLCSGECEITGSASLQYQNQSPSAWTHVRVPRGEVAVFTQKLEKSGAATSTNLEREDKTLQVIDVEARTANLVELRDRVRNLLTTPGAKLPDLLAVERELARAQSELDSMTAQRKHLALETDKVSINLQYQVSPVFAEEGALTPLTTVLLKSAKLMASSTANVLQAIFVYTPWVILILLLGLLAKTGFKLMRIQRDKSKT